MVWPLVSGTGTTAADDLAHVGCRVGPPHICLIPAELWGLACWLVTEVAALADYLATVKCTLSAKVVRLFIYSLPDFGHFTSKISLLITSFLLSIFSHFMYFLMNVFPLTRRCKSPQPVFVPYEHAFSLHFPCIPGPAAVVGNNFHMS